MLAAVFKSANRLDVEDYPLRRLEEHEILVKVNYCGVCGTDFHIYQGNAPSNPPIIMGHEYSGIVADKVGNETKIRIGDKVVIDPNIYCGYCNYCRIGKVNFCENHKALGVNLNGGFAEYSIVPISQAYLLPNEFDLSIAAFTEPLSCCLRGIEHADIKHGDSLIIIGGGTIGLIMVQLAKISGAAKIILVEPITFKQKLGMELGADLVVDPNEINLFKLINEFTNSYTNIVLECVGTKETVELSVRLAGKGGKVVIFGLAPKDQSVSLNLQFLFQNEIRISSSYLNPFLFKTAIDFLINKRINVKKLVSKQISLEYINNVFNNANDYYPIKQQILTN